MGQICHHFGWTLDYLLWEVDWRIVQRMLIDAPNYDDDKKEKEIDLTEQTPEDLEKMLEKYR
ncbi:hypothetical protein OKE68_11010 [Riemerella anatipestifer]|uniref:Uncharacterized protein n=2 Tax=Riemerella anatipestifer TaxID=34085 RepID=E4TE74_RIEAD|nr:hypothetical protein [Riemerella anatipestifer]YP_007003615.1 hypothetical protein F372_gp16 [Riemerella phage RAP44]WGH49502.1 hypothetical protein CRP2_000061 [Riemerella phage vB_RanS_CRP2]ADQ83083.1 hypothetical protein Riean_1930 [Riemerella anatipestifer ATCC 11845 = DSM 15868]ADZ11407.1 hypothetical protein RIA_0220 [Riemerella anatipestifer RA-GD]AEB71690.1 hypothetical protein [Riemerella phage RAP44]AFD55145.1 hypothetical protein RA0C_0130 [Riemerella anatipestifer ATCC 11845 = 